MAIETRESVQEATMTTIVNLCDECQREVLVHQYRLCFVCGRMICDKHEMVRFDNNDICQACFDLSEEFDFTLDISRAQTIMGNTKNAIYARWSNNAKEAE